MKASPRIPTQGESQGGQLSSSPGRRQDHSVFCSSPALVTAEEHKFAVSAPS